MLERAVPDRAVFWDCWKEVVGEWLIRGYLRRDEVEAAHDGK